MYFPLFVDLTRAQVLVVGAGRIAARRVCALAGFAGHVTVVAPEVDGRIAALEGELSVTVCRRGFCAEDLEGRQLVLAATDDAELNREIYRLCKEKGIPVNNCSDQRMCDFQFPSIVRDGDLVIGINASGRDHARVKKTRQIIENALEAQRPKEAGQIPGRKQSQEVLEDGSDSQKI